MGRIAQLGRWYGLFAVCLLVVHGHSEVHLNPLVSELGEAGADKPAGNKAVFTEDTKGALPPGTQVLRHIEGIQNSKCRYECYEEAVCSAYSWKGSSNECVLLQAPSHFQSPSANDAWHMAAANLTGIPYEQDEAQLAMIAAAKKMAEEAAEDTRRGKLTIDENLKEEIAALKKRTSEEVKEAGNPEKVKELGLESQFQINEMKKYVAKHRDAFAAEVSRQTDFYAREAAKAEMRSDTYIKKLRAEHFKNVDKKLADMSEEMKPTVEGKVARDVTRTFLRGMRQDTLRKVTGFRKDMILAKEQKEAEEKKKAKEAAEKKREKIRLKKLEAKKDKGDLVKYAVNEQQQKKKASAQAEEKQAKEEPAKPMTDAQKSAAMKKDIQVEKANAKRSQAVAKKSKDQAKQLKQESKRHSDAAQKSSDASKKKKLSKKADDADKEALAHEKKAAEAENAAAKSEAAIKEKKDALKKKDDKEKDTKKDKKQDKKQDKKKGDNIKYFMKV